MSNRKKILLYRTETSGNTTSNIEVGELAMNYNSESPFLMFKNNQAKIEKIGSLASSTGTSEFKVMSQKTVTTELNKKVNNSLVGSVNGIAELDENGKVPSTQLPSYVDDVLEYTNKASFPKSGETGKIYVAIDSNKTYRWGGSGYVEISESLALGETDKTAYRGDRGKAAYEHSLLKKGNPHNVTKAEVGLGNVENKSSETIRSEITKLNVTTALGYTPANELLPDTYTTVTYPTFDNVVFNQNRPKDNIFVSIHNIDENVLTLTNEMVVNENIISNTITNLNRQIGFQDNVNYPQNGSATFINTANSLVEADNLLDSALSTLSKKNTFNNISVGQSLLSPKKVDDILTIEGKNVTVSSESTLNKILLNITNSNVTSALGYTPSSNILPESYFKLTYPVVENITFNENKPNDDIFVSIHNLDENILSLTNEMIDNEEVLASSITNLKDIIGIETEVVEYVPNDSATYINTASSMIDADNKLDLALKELSNKNSFGKVSVGDILVFPKSKDSNLVFEGSNVTLTADNSLSKVTFGITDSNVNSALGYTPANELLPDTYTTVTYPTVSNVTFNSNKAKDNLSLSIHNLDSNIATLANEMIKNENVIAKTFTTIKDSVGLGETLEYTPDKSNPIIKNAETISQAINIIANILNEKIINGGTY